MKIISIVFCLVSISTHSVFAEESCDINVNKADRTELLKPHMSFLATTHGRPLVLVNCENPELSYDKIPTVNLKMGVCSVQPDNNKMIMFICSK